MRNSLPKVVTNTAKAVSIYLLASLLLAACQNGSRQGKVTVQKGGAAGPDDQKPVVEQLEFTGATDELKDRYGFLGEGTYPKAAVKSIDVDWSSDEIDNAIDASGDFASMEVVSRKGKMFFLTGLLPNEKNKLKETKDIALELVEKQGGTKRLFEGKGEGLELQMSCDENCKTARLNVVVVEDPDKRVKIPFSVEVRKAVLSDVQALFDKDNKAADKGEIADAGRGVKKHVLQALVEKPNLDAVLVSTVNLATLESRIFLGLEGEVEKNRKQRLEVISNLTEIKGDARPTEFVLDPQMVRPTEVLRTRSDRKVIRFSINVGEKKGDATLSPSRVEFNVSATEQ